jgi:hypothetical protein
VPTVDDSTTKSINGRHGIAIHQLYMISVLKQSSAMHASTPTFDGEPEHRPVAAGFAMQCLQHDGVVQAEQPRKSDPFGRAVTTVVVTIAVQTVASLIIASILFDGTLILLAAGTGSTLMTFVGLPTLLAAIGDIHADAACRVVPSRPADATDVRGQTVRIANLTRQPMRASHVHGHRDRVSHQMPDRALRSTRHLSEGVRVMKIDRFSHAGCPVCVNAENHFAESLGPCRLEIEVVTLRQSKAWMADAERAGVRSVSAAIAAHRALAELEEPRNQELRT